MSRAQRFLDTAQAQNVETSEVLLVTDAHTGTTLLQDALLGLLNGESPERLISAPNGGPWAYALLTESPFPDLPSDVLSLRRYVLTHAIFFTTNYGRNPLSVPSDDPLAVRLSNLVLDEAAPDLLGEYLICQLALGQTPDTGAYADWYDQPWDAVTHAHAVGALLFALMGD